MAKTNKTATKAEEMAKASEVDPNTGLDSLKEESSESTENVKGSEPDLNAIETQLEEINPKQIVTDYTYDLSEIVKNHHVNPDTYSKTRDYNLLMQKIELLKSDILKFIN